MKVTERAITFCLKGLTWRVISSHQEVLSSINERLHDYFNETKDYQFVLEVLDVCKLLEKISNDASIDISPYNAVLIINLFFVE